MGRTALKARDYFEPAHQGMAIAAEDDYDFMPAHAWSGYSETGENDASSRPREGYPGLHDLPGKNTILEPVDGHGGFDVAPKLGAEEGPGGLEWDPSPTYRTRYKNGTNYLNGATHHQGNNWFTQIPYLTYDSGSNEYRVRFDANTFRIFTYDSGAGYWKGSRGSHDLKLKILTIPRVFDAGGKEYIFESPDGQGYARCLQINGLSGTNISFTYNANDITVKQKNSAGATVRTFEYVLSGNVIDLIKIKNASGTKYREIDFTYNDDVTNPDAEDSLSGDLIAITDRKILSDGSWLERSWAFKYYVGAPLETGSPHQVRAVIGPQSVANYSGDVHTDTYATLLAAGALDKTFEYDATSKRVSKLTIAGNCGCGGGEGVYTYTWQTNGTTPTSLNTWNISMTTTFPDSSTRTFDYNIYGQTINAVIADGASQWLRKWVFYENSSSAADGSLHLAYPFPACTSYNSSTHTIGEDNSNYGGRFLYQYSSSDKTLKYIRRLGRFGFFPVDLYLAEKNFAKYESSNRLRFLKTLHRRYPTETTTASNGHATTFSYAFEHSDAIAISKRTTTLPVVPTSENGPGGATGVETFTWFSETGDIEWLADGEGYVSFFKRDDDGEVEVEVIDIDTAAPPTESGLSSNAEPDSDFTTPADGGLNIVTQYERDDVGRIVQKILPSYSAYDGTSIVNDLKIRNRWHYGQLAGGEAVVLYYPNVEGPDPVTQEFEYYDASVSISVSDHAGNVVTSALGTPTTKDANFVDDLGSGSTIDAAFAGTITRRSDSIYDDGRLTEQRVWKDADNSSGGYIMTRYGYDTMGRRNRSVSPAGTISKTTFDALNRVLTTSVGTDDSGGGSDNMRVVTERIYDEITGGSRNRNNLGQVTTIRSYTDATNYRTVEIDYDRRGRRRETRSPIDLKTVPTYDNTGSATKTEVFDTSGASDLLIEKSETIYDVLGRAYETRRHGINSSGSSVGYTSSESWYDGRGLTVKTKSGGAVYSKTSYDGAARSVRASTSIDSTETDSDYAAALTLDGDTVISETYSVYDQTGAVTHSSVYERNASVTGTGPLRGSGCTVGIASLASHSSTWYDVHLRPTVSVSYGDNGGTPLCARPSGNPPTISSSTRIVTQTLYTLSSQVDDTIDPDGRKTVLTYRDTGELESRTENYKGSGAFSSASPDENRITEYETKYSHQLFAGGKTYPKVEITTERNRTWDPTIGATGAYIDHVSARGYGVTSGANADDSKIDSNDLLEAVFAPDRSTGAISNESSKLAYNLQREVIYRKARGDAAEHVFTIDDAGQVTSDEVIVHGEANDTLIDEITYTRDARGRVTLVTSHDLDTSSVVNEVEFVIGSFGETTSVKQQNDGEVGDPGTKTTTLSYSYPTAGESTVRLTSTTYPNGQVVTTEYDSGIDAALGRVSGRKYSSSWLFKDKYVGAGRLSERAYGDPISASKWQLSFDRFGRPGELTVGSIVDNTYTYSASGNLTFREDDIANTYGQKTHSEKYTYNGLDYLTKRERGVGGSGSIYNVVESECLTRDPAGNVTARYVGAASSCGATTDFRFNGRSEISEHKPPSESWNPLWAAYSDWGTLIQKGGSSGGGGGAGQGGGAGVSYGGTTNKTDDWNRVVEVAVDGQTVETFEYSGTGWMVEKGSDDLYYDPAGRLLDDGHHWHVWGPTGSNDYVGLGLSAGGFYVYHIQDAVTRDTIVEMFPNGNVYYYFRYDAYGAPTMEDSGRTSTIAVWGDVVLRGGAQYLRSLGYYVGGRGVLSDVLIGAVANGAVVMQVDDTPQDPNDPEHPGYKGGGPEEEEPEDIPRDGTKLTCGLDVTDALIALRDDVKNKYDEQDAGTRYRACVGLYSFSPTLSVTRAWDIMALHFRRQNFFTIAECGRPDPPCGNTVQVTDPTDGTIACFDQAEVNYFLYGIANRICANDSVNRRTVVMELPKSRWLPNGFSATWSYNNHDSQGVLEDLIRFWHKVASNSGDPDCKVAWFRAGYMGWPEDVGMPKPCGDSKFCGKCNRSWPAFRSWVWEPFEERK